MRKYILLTLLLLGVMQLSSRTSDGFHAYVGAIDHESVTLAWGTTEGKGNTIGQNAQGIGRMTAFIGDKKTETDRAWTKMTGLRPDTQYPYKLVLNSKVMAEGTVRTWPKQSKSLTFFLIGDWGNGSSGQIAIAAAMTREFRRLEKEGTPVRFVLSTGDNIYGVRATGWSDDQWEEKFFTPYEEILRSIPFYAVLGNHDGNESERHGDLAVYLDNFFFPVGGQHRWYRFEYGEFAEFFALDSTRNQLSGPPLPIYGPESEQSKWLKEQLAGRPLPWRFAVFHHPLFTAGPYHAPTLPELKHWFELFRKENVRAVFSGHEHNFQLSERNAATGNMTFVLSGAGGELRAGDVRRKMPGAQIAAWAPQRHFCIVQLSETGMSITPVTDGPLLLRDARGARVPVPIVLPREVPRLGKPQ